MTGFQFKRALSDAAGKVKHVYGTLDHALLTYIIYTAKI